MELLTKCQINAVMRSAPDAPRRYEVTATVVGIAAGQKPAIFCTPSPFGAVAGGDNSIPLDLAPQPSASNPNGGAFISAGSPTVRGAYNAPPFGQDVALNITVKLDGKVVDNGYVILAGV